MNNFDSVSCGASGISVSERQRAFGAIAPGTVAGVAGAIVPGAFGFGMDTRAAHGLIGTNPTIYRVQNLNDSGANSFRAAVEASGPRVVIFETSGTCTAGSDINITNPYITIAGQTAPAPGFTLKGFGLQNYTHDVFVQHLRIRAGDGPPLIDQTADHDCNINYTSNCYNAVYDHCSFSWAQDKLTNVYSVPLNAGFSYWRCIFSESLYRAANIIPQGGSWGATGAPSSLNSIFKQSDVALNANISVVQCLYAHNSDRNPEIQGPVSVHLVNNVIYDWGKDANNYPWATFIYAQGADLPPKVDIVGNVYIAGPNTGSFLPLIAVGTYNVPVGTQVYLSDNVIDSVQQSVTDFFAQSGLDPRVGSPPVSLSGFTLIAGSSTKAWVLARAGARPANRDSVDTRIVADVSAYTGNVIASQTSVGGWPTLAVNTRALTEPSNYNTVQASGYTAGEEWLQGYATGVE